MQKRALRTLAVGLLTAALASGLWTTRLEAGCAQEPAPPAPPEEELQAPAVDESAPESAEERSPRLIGEAEALAAGGMASAAEVKELSRLMRELKEALEKKAERLETGGPTEEVDAPLESTADELEALSAGVAERAASAETVPEAAGPRPTEGVLASFGSALEDAAGVLQRLQEIRTALGSAKDEEAAEAAPGGAEPEPVEEAQGDVSGSVTEDGRPVEGVTVADPETGVKATTGADGLFHLVGVPAGRLVTLVASKAGRPLGQQQVLPTAGRPAVADFGGAAKATSGAVRLRPSIMRVPSAPGQASGTILGEVRDPRGRPGAGAAVALHHLGVVRSDSRGRFAFLGVPAGAHRITVQLRGHQPKLEAVRVATKTRADLRVRLSATPRPVPTRVAWRGPGATAQVRGVVVDREGRPVVGARIRLVRAAQTVSVVSSARGAYAVASVQGGQYHMLVSKAGFQTGAVALTLSARETKVLTFRLLRKPGTTDVARLRTAPTRTTPTAPVRTTPSPRPAGTVRGHVVDAQTGRPVAGARLRLAGKGAVADAAGAFRLPHLDPGSHRLVVEATGFAASERAVVVQAARDVVLTLPLTPLRARAQSVVAPPVRR
jgi:Carboxypeptidase regulatory-like domain